MNPAKLTPGTKYTFQHPEQEPETLTYVHETLNHWFFISDNNSEQIYLTIYQLKNLSAI